MLEKEKRDESQGKLEQRRQKISNWLKNPYNLAIAGILIFAFIIKLYFFVLTSQQTLWWDEAECMSTAKHWAFNVPYELNPHRMPLFQFLAALFFITGFKEVFIKFILVFLPSLFLVFAVYLLGKEMFNKKIALIAALLTSLSWTLLFWATRFQTDFLSMSFQVLSILFMWKYWKYNKSSFIIWAGFFAGLAFLSKVSALLVPMIFIVFIFLKDRFSALKNKNYYYFALTFLLVLIPYFIWSYSVFGNPLGFKSGYLEAVARPVSFGWYNLIFYYKLTDNVSFILFLLGLVISLDFLFYSDILIKDKNKCFNPNLFSILALAVISAFYIFYIKQTDDRWVFLWLPFIFFLVGKGLILIYKLIKKYNKFIAILIIAGLLVSSLYLQWNYANSLIMTKKDTYIPVKQAALWIKDNSNLEDVILTISHPQTVYYSERLVYNFRNLNKSEFDKLVIETKPTFLIISIFEDYPDWINEWVNENKEKLNPVNAYFADPSRQQAVLVIYKFLY